MLNKKYIIGKKIPNNLKVNSVYNERFYLNEITSFHFESKSYSISKYKNRYFSVSNNHEFEISRSTFEEIGQSSNSKILASIRNNYKGDYINFFCDYYSNSNEIKILYISGCSELLNHFESEFKEYILEDISSMNEYDIYKMIN